MSFENLNFSGAAPTSVPIETIEVIVDPATMVDDYADACVREIRRCDPRRYEQVSGPKEEVRLDEKTMRKYCRFILHQRVLCVWDDCKDWRKLKNLWIPVFIQYAISLVGRVEIYDRGLVLMPKYASRYNDDEEYMMTLEEALAFSGLLGIFQKSIQIKKDAMPREKMGDRDTMSCALIAGYVRTLKPVEHPVSTYVAAFLGFMLQKEAAFQTLYRVQYDDIEFIRSALINSKEVYGSGSFD